MKQTAVRSVNQSTDQGEWVILKRSQDLFTLDRFILERTTSCFRPGFSGSNSYNVEGTTSFASESLSEQIRVENVHAASRFAEYSVAGIWKYLADEAADDLTFTEHMASPGMYFAQRLVQRLELDRARKLLAEMEDDPVVRLMQGWMADESGYDERAWPVIKKAIEEHRLSYRRRFGD